MFYIKTILWGFHFAIFGKFQLQYYGKLICNIEEKVLAKNIRSQQSGSGQFTYNAQSKFFIC
jgi:hypothetical protein